MSSFFFFIISPVMLYLLHPYAKERSLAIHIVWIMMIFVGQLVFIYLFIDLMLVCICPILSDIWRLVILIFKPREKSSREFSLRHSYECSVRNTFLSIFVFCKQTSNDVPCSTCQVDKSSGPKTNPWSTTRTKWKNILTSTMELCNETI